MTGRSVVADREPGSVKAGFTAAAVRPHQTPQGG